MASQLSLVLGAFAGFIADAAQQTEAHLMQDCRCATGFFLVPLGAEVDGSLFFKPIRGSGDVWTLTVETGKRGVDLAEFFRVFSFAGVGQKRIDFVANRKSGLQ